MMKEVRISSDVAPAVSLLVQLLLRMGPQVRASNFCHATFG